VAAVFAAADIAAMTSEVIEPPPRFA